MPSEFVKKLEERVRAIYRENSRLIGCDEERAALAGAAAALEIAAEEIGMPSTLARANISPTPSERVAHRIAQDLRTRAREIRGGE